ncbi:hypothetical protein HDU76_011826, partial [Blyttiomyces sp. JEL0837]
PNGMFASPKVMTPVAPTDQEIISEIRTIVHTSDLRQLTTRQVRTQLNERFGVDLDDMGKRDFIRDCVKW